MVIASRFLGGLFDGPADRVAQIFFRHRSTGFADCRQLTKSAFLRTALLEHRREPSHIVEVHQGRIGQNIHGAPVIAPAGLLALRPSRIVVSVAGAGPRARIRTELAAMGFRELRDFICAA